MHGFGRASHKGLPKIRRKSRVEETYDWEDYVGYADPQYSHANKAHKIKQALQSIHKIKRKRRRRNDIPEEQKYYYIAQVDCPKKSFAKLRSMKKKFKKRENNIVEFPDDIEQYYVDKAKKTKSKSSKKKKRFQFKMFKPNLKLKPNFHFSKIAVFAYECSCVVREVGEKAASRMSPVCVAVLVGIFIHLVALYLIYENMKDYLVKEPEISLNTNFSF